MKLGEILNNVELDKNTVIELGRALLLRAVPEKINVINACIDSIKNTPNHGPNMPEPIEEPQHNPAPVNNYMPQTPNAPTDKQMYRIKKIEEETGDKFTGSTKADAFKFISSHSK